MSVEPRGGGFRPLRASLDTWRPGRARALDPLQAIVASWPGIVGADVAANAVPLEIAGSALVVGTRSSAWSQQLQFLSLPILAALRDLACGAAIEKLIFRTGTGPRGTPLPRTAKRVSRASTVRSAPAFVPAGSLEEAFARLRQRMIAARQAMPALATCQDCGLAREAPPPSAKRGAAAVPLRCAPCAGEAERARRIAVERTVYMAPWLTATDLREEMPDLTVAEFERARKALLGRWWLALERARRSGRLSATGLERHVGSSYVLLQSRLPPDKITPAVVRNLLGAELEMLLWPHRVATANAP